MADLQLPETQNHLVFQSFRLLVMPSITDFFLLLT